MDIVFILPNQLFQNNKLINKDTKVFIYEHPVYFTKYEYHKLKLILHRASMKQYADYLYKTKKCKVTYLEYNYNINTLFKKFSNKKVDMYDPVDHDVVKEYKSLSKKYKIELFMHDTPMFICTLPDLNEYLDKGDKYNQTSFYIWQRKRLDILVTKDKKPIGNKWTFDKENRLPFPDNVKKDIKFKANSDKYTKEAVNYIEKYFKDNLGENDLYIPIDHNGAKRHLNKFLKDRLNCFGPYQDAVDKDIVFGCHAVISPYLNIGLLTPDYVIDKIIKYYNSNKKSVKLQSVEAIIRQIIGWREIIRMMYMFKHGEMIKLNHFKHKNKLSNEWYTGETNIEPIDDIINKVLKYGYAHHIERLMYLGNFMLINKIKPSDVYKWFMCLFIDSYQWVMEANIYAMSQYSTGPMLMTRPYFSSSNYIKKMSNYNGKKDVYKKIKLGKDEYEWFEIWDALYYNFIKDNKTEFSKNYAIASAVGHWKRKSKSEQKELVTIANKYISIY